MRLNIGAGSSELSGFTGVDIHAGQDATKLPYEDNSVDEIYASHVLEHWDFNHTQAVLAEWVRVLRPNGRMRIAVPDFDWILRAYTQGVQAPIEGYLLGGHIDENDVHHAIFNRDKLRDLLRSVGLTRISKWEPEIEDCSALPCSLNLQGYKRDTGQQIKGVVAVMSIPRLVFADNMFQAMRVFTPLHIPMIRAGGVFYGQAMTRLFKEAMATPGCRYILTLDYDTLFTSENVIDLFDIMETHLEIDALCPVQIRREGTTALMTKAGADGEPVTVVMEEELSRETMPIMSGHFGLTMLRVDALKNMDKPWFVAVPDEDGDWGTGRTDEDSNFWRTWRKSGNTIASANHVGIGHMQLMATWPTRELTPVSQLVTEWEEHGKPQEAL